eukprot:SAG25_NODE_71_length_17290_cov_41.467861_14_plen_82_part_00
MTYIVTMAWHRWYRELIGEAVSNRAEVGGVADSARVTTMYAHERAATSMGRVRLACVEDGALKLQPAGRDYLHKVQCVPGA